jgi:hypothetical protein
MAPLLTQQLSHEGEWECSTCIEPCTETSPKPWEDTAANCLVCENCIRSRFKQALKYEHHMPAAWGEEELDINDYAYALLNADFVLAYPIAWFRKIIREASRPHDAAILAGEMPDGWELGRQYQHCPVCLKAVQLQEACNHMACPLPCKTNYCYICGKEVSTEGLSSHWAKGGCPRDNHPDDADARFDGEYDEDENEDDDESDDVNMDLNSELSFDTTAFIRYAWNMAMQTADHRTRQAMRNILSRGENILLSHAPDALLSRTEEFLLSSAEDLRLNDVTRDEIDRVHAAMNMHSEGHGVDARMWNYITGRHAVGTQKFLERPGWAEYSSRLSIVNGLLKH